MPNISFSSSGSAWSKPSRCSSPCVVSSSELVDHAVAGGLRLGLARPAGRARCRRAGRPGSGCVFGARAQLVHRKAEHVGRAGLVHPLHVQLLHRGLVDEHDREFRIRVHVHRVERVRGRAAAVPPRRPGSPDSLLTSMLTEWPLSSLGKAVARDAGAAFGTIGELCCLLALVVQRLLLLVVDGVRVDDAADERVPHDVVAGQAGEVDVVDVCRARASRAAARSRPSAGRPG